MLWGKTKFTLLNILFFGCLLFCIQPVHSEIIGNPPYKTIKIPPSAFGYHFDMEQDNEKVLYAAYSNGIKIFDGALWHVLEIGKDSFIRRLYFGGSGLYGYVYKDNKGSYQYKIITPKEHLGQLRILGTYLSAVMKLLL